MVLKRSSNDFNAAEGSRKCKRGFSLLTLVVTLLLLSMMVQPVFAYSDQVVLKQDMRNSDVAELQHDLQKLGYFSLQPTGYYGAITKSAVISFQKAHGLSPDGIAGVKTISKLRSVISSDPVVVTRGHSRTDARVLAPVIDDLNPVELLPWFGEMESLFAIGTTATLTDIETGLQFQVKRTYGRNHADVEASTAGDTEILLSAIGGNWNWDRRPVIVAFNGYRVAGSLAAMPHAGIDGQPVNSVVSNRSGGFGRGVNLNTVQGNGMNGHMDLHFYGSRTHGSNRVDNKHQEAVMSAYTSGS